MHIADILIWIALGFLFLKSIFDFYILARQRAVRRWKNTVWQSLPRHCTYKYMVALHTYLNIRWEALPYKNFFKWPITSGDIMDPNTRKLLLGSYDINSYAPITPEELSVLIHTLPGHMYNIRSKHEAKKDPEQYEF